MGRWDSGYTVDKMSFVLLGILEDRISVEYTRAYARMKTIFPEDITLEKFDSLVKSLKGAEYVLVDDTRPIYIDRTKKGADAYETSRSKYEPEVRKPSERFFRCPKCHEDQMVATGGSVSCRGCGFGNDAD